MVYFTSSEDSQLQLLNLDSSSSNYQDLNLLPLAKYFEDTEFESLRNLLDHSPPAENAATTWEVNLMDQFKRAVHKKRILDFNRQHFSLDTNNHHHQHHNDPMENEMKDFFTPLEQRLLSLISDTTTTLPGEEAKSSSQSSLVVPDNRFQIEICRVCCHHKSNAMLSIFSSSPSGPTTNTDGLTYAMKIGICADVPIEEQDTLPKSICRDCAINLEACYEFVKLCRESDFELRRDKTLRDMIMEQVLDKTMGYSVDNSCWSSSSSNSSPTTTTTELLKAFDMEQQQPITNKVTSGMSNNTNLVPGDCPVGSGSEIIQQLLAAGASEVPAASPAPSSVGGDENCDIRKFQCDICGSRFFDIYNFKTHLRIHKVVKKYECTSQGCAKKFRTNVMLKIHLR